MYRLAITDLGMVTMQLLYSRSMGSSHACYIYHYYNLVSTYKPCTMTNFGAWVPYTNVSHGTTIACTYITTYYYCAGTPVSQHVSSSTFVGVAVGCILSTVAVYTVVLLAGVIFIRWRRWKR